jgi:hypothetical protein
MATQEACRYRKKQSALNACKSLWLCIFLVVIISLSDNSASPAAPAATGLSAEQARDIIAMTASRAVQALKSRDMNELSKLVHPVKAVRFSPYAFLDVKADQRFTAVMIRGALADSKARVWGRYDGSGKPIRLSFSEYYKRFVYDRDFAHASEIFYNGTRESLGNTHDNSREEYPEAIIVEFHVPGPAGQDDTGFRGLRLVFEQYRDAWYLVHIIHDEWTI